MYSHPSIALKVEMRAVEERFGIVHRGISVQRASEKSTVLMIIAALQKLVSRFVQKVPVQNGPVQNGPTQQESGHKHHSALEQNPVKI